MKVNRRLRRWVDDLGQWATKRVGNIDTDEEQYAYGVVMAVGTFQGFYARFTPAAMEERYKPGTAAGYFDGLDLIRGVIRDGVTPGNDFEGLLGVTLMAYQHDPPGSHIPEE